MSLESWKAEFLPKPAKDVLADEAIAHSLQKWRGLTKEARDKHGLSEVDFKLLINGNSCALCLTNDACSTCPIMVTTELFCGQTGSAWSVAKRIGNPQPMIDLLQLLKDKENEQRKLVS